MDDDEFDPREVYSIVDQIIAEDDANDPLLESYNRRDSGEIT